MGTTNLEGSMRAALATAELDDADLRQIYDELKSIKTDALDPAGKLAMAITRSQTETRLASHAAVKALFALAPAADAADSATESKWAPISTPRRPTSGGFEETVIVPPGVHEIRERVSQNPPPTLKVIIGLPCDY
jgi:hypothetical protein